MCHHRNSAPPPAKLRKTPALLIPPTTINPHRATITITITYQTRYTPMNVSRILRTRKKAKEKKP